MDHTTAKNGLMEYKSWRKSLIALPIGTIVEWIVPYNGVTLASSIKSGQRFQITALSQGVMSGDNTAASQSYAMVLVNAAGKQLKKTARWNVEAVARFLAHAEVSIVE